MTFACKKCKKCFRKDAQEFDESDEYCPHCDNHFVLNAVTPKAALQVEGADVRIDARYGPSLYGLRYQLLTCSRRMLKDDRVRGEQQRNIWDVQDTADRLG